jgi:hypothetical protein
MQVEKDLERRTSLHSMQSSSLHILLKQREDLDAEADETEEEKDLPHLLDKY